MGFRIGKRFSFDAAHHLPGLPDGHPCGRLHGHTYTVEVVLERDELVPPGFVTDFGDLEPLRRHLDERMDHRHLNEVVAFPPTSEQLARYVAEWFGDHLQRDVPGRLVAVRVSETPASWAEYMVEQP